MDVCLGGGFVAICRIRAWFNKKLYRLVIVMPGSSIQSIHEVAGFRHY